MNKFKVGQIVRFKYETVIAIVKLVTVLNSCYRVDMVDPSDYKRVTDEVNLVDKTHGYPGHMEFSPGQLVASFYLEPLSEIEELLIKLEMEESA